LIRLATSGLDRWSSLADKSVDTEPGLQLAPSLLRFNFMKKTELLLSAIFLPLDFASVILAGLSAYYIRFSQMTVEIRPVIFNLQITDYLKLLLVIAVVWTVVFIFSGLYSINRSKRLRHELRRVILASSLGLVLVVVYIFFFREWFSSRFIVLVGWLLTMIYLSVIRILMDVIKHTLYRYGIGVRQVVMVGNSQTTDNLIKIFATQLSLGYHVIKRLPNFSLETANEFADYIKHHQIDEVIQSDPNLSKAEILRLYDFADQNHLNFKYAADLLGAKVLRVEVNEIGGIPVVEVKKTPLDGWGRILKRLFDIIVSLLLIMLSSPVMLITAILIKLDSAGPIFYKNERSHKGGTFKLYKFRSMRLDYCVGADYSGTDKALQYEQQLINDQNTKDGPIYKIADDPRITRVGRFIRRWSIDELPQFFNVFCGSLSLVGPRPHQPREVAKYEGHHKKVLSIKPGITGMAQVSGRSDLSFEEEVKLDVYYIENWSLLKDIIIILRTPWAVLRPRRVA